jgi:hypothetical protein
MSIIHAYLFDNTKCINSEGKAYPFKYLIFELTEDHVDFEPFLREIQTSMCKRIYDYVKDKFIVVISIKHFMNSVDISTISNNNILLENFDESMIEIVKELEEEPKYEIIGYNITDDTIGSISSDEVKFKLSILSGCFNDNQNK